MKLKIHPLTVFAVSIVLLGCDQDKPGASRTPSESGTTAEAVRKEIKDAATASKDYVVKAKDQFVAAAEPKLKAFDEKIEELGKKAGSLAADAKAEGIKALDLMREKRTQASAKLEELKRAGQDNWNDVKAGFDSAMSELERAYGDAKAKLSN